MNWQRLAVEVQRRRTHLGYPTRKEFAAATKFAPKTLGDLETLKRTNFSQVTLAQLEKALDWPEGRIAEILATAEPVPLVMTEHGPVSRATELVMYALDSGRLALTMEQRERLAWQIELAVAPYIDLALQEWERRRLEWERQKDVPFPEGPPDLRLIHGGGDEVQRSRRMGREGAGG